MAVKLDVDAVHPPARYGLAWASRLIPTSKGQSTKPWAATYEDAKKTCRRLNREYPALHHWPILMDAEDA